MLAPLLHFHWSHMTYTIAKVTCMHIIHNSRAQWCFCVLQKTTFGAEDDIRSCLPSKSFQLQQKFLWHPLNRTSEQSNRLHQRWVMQKEWWSVMHIIDWEFSLFFFYIIFHGRGSGYKRGPMTEGTHVTIDKRRNRSSRQTFKDKHPE